MKHGRITYLLLFTAMALVTSCQKVISLKLNNAAPQLVIEGNLTNVYGVQYVVISKSVAFTATDNFPPVTGADVSITDNTTGIVYKFKEDTLGIYSFYPMIGVAGTTYTLNVTTGGQTYTASSTMPAPVMFDSVTTRNAILESSNTRILTVNYQDPPTQTNYYRFAVAVDGQGSGNIFVDDDQFTNGRYVRQDLFQNSPDVHAHDTVSVEMQCIDKPIYTYWYSLGQQQLSGPGGGTAPSNPPSNFNNNALGYFSAHTSQIETIIIN